MKFRTNEEAKKKITNLQQSLTIQHDNITYAAQRIGRPFESVDIFILNTEKLKSWEEFIKLSGENISNILEKIEKYKPFLTEPYRWFIY